MKDREPIAPAREITEAVAPTPAAPRVRWLDGKFVPREKASPESSDLPGVRKPRFGSRALSRDVVLSSPSRSFDFSNMAGQTTRTLVLTRATCVEERRELVIVVRVHAINIGGAATFRFIVVAAAPTSEEPETEFPGTTELARVDVHGTSAGTLLVAAIPAPLPTHVQIRVVAVQDVLAQQIRATLSFDIEGKY
jgi:hypothetical protein